MDQRRKWAYSVAAILLGGMMVAAYWMRHDASEPVPSVATPEAVTQFTGSGECRECHQTFYEKWAPSHHGLAMQPYSAALAKEKLTAAQAEVVIGPYRYQPEIQGETGALLEIGPQGERRYPMLHVMGGKNVYYFLTLLEKGRLQVLPVAYDVHRREWFDTTASAVRHFRDDPDQALHWLERPLTFNTSCHGCHVSQLSSNYDPVKDTYQTTWAEPGINCETCHGPGGEHVRLFRALPKGQTAPELKILSTKMFSAAQINALCAPCHAKMSPLSSSFKPGDRYFDHFDLTCLEDRDFYPDGRDLGENYTYTHWLMSPCAKAGELDCAHCHTSSGRYRFTGADANQACMPCHKNHVENAAQHSRHAAQTPGSQCVSCHMPKTEFARMWRSDHSMRPPTPATTLAFQSPNACNLCHTNQTAAWADQWVRQWRPRDYQAPILHQANLIETARRGQWARLPKILDYLGQTNREEVVAASLIRLLSDCESPDKTPALLQALKDSSPLVRASAASTLGSHLTPAMVEPLLEATRDEYRLVRVRAAVALAAAPAEMIPPAARAAFDRAKAEFEDAMRSRPDDPTTLYNLGNFYLAQGDAARAVNQFETSARLQPDHLAALVNGSLAYAQLADNERAESFLRRAHRLAPTNAAVNLNLGLLLGELNRMEEAVSFLRQALKADPRSVTAAYNLGILLAKEQPAEALDLFRQALRWQPDQPRNAYTLAFFLLQNHQTDEAEKVLREQVEQNAAHPGLYQLLGGIWEKQGKAEQAAALYRQAAHIQPFSPADRDFFLKQSQRLTAK